MQAYQLSINIITFLLRVVVVGNDFPVFDSSLNKLFLVLCEWNLGSQSGDPLPGVNIFMAASSCLSLCLIGSGPVPFFMLLHLSAMLIILSLEYVETTKESYYRQPRECGDACLVYVQV